MADRLEQQNRESAQHRAYAKEREKVWFRWSVAFFVPSILIGAVSFIAPQVPLLFGISLVLLLVAGACSLIMGLWALTSETV